METRTGTPGGCTSTPASSGSPEAGGEAWTPDLVVAAVKGFADFPYASAVDFNGMEEVEGSIPFSST